MAGDWLKLHRDIRDHAVMQDSWLCHLWIWCLVNANYVDGTFKGTPVKRGSFVTGSNSASQQLGVSPSKFYRGLQKLTELGCITVQANNKWTTVSVCNYNTYQDRKESERKTNEEQMENERKTSEKQMNTIEERKNLRREELNTKVISGLENQIKEDAKAEQSPAHQILGDAFRSVVIPAPMVPLPDVLDVPGFQAVWRDWLNYMTVQKRHRYAQDTMQAHLSELSRDGPITAAKRLEHAKKIGITYPANLPQDKPATTKQQQPDWLTKARAKNANKTA